MMKMLLKLILNILLRSQKDSDLALENLALRQQLAIWKRHKKRPQIRTKDRLFWIMLCRFWSNWRQALIVVKPETVIQILFVLVILSHRQRQIVHFNVTTNPSARWTAQQIVEAFPWDTAPKYLLRDRDSIYGAYFRQRVKNMGIKEVITAARSPWQNPFVERLIGSIRRDCLDHVIVLNESHLSRILSSYFDYYHYDRTHYGLGKDTPVERPAQPRPTKGAKVIELPRVGGLHHRYEWKEAA